MFNLTELKGRLKFWREADRIGPDILSTHWQLYFQSTMMRLCKNKFASFSDTSDFRPGAYATVCSKISIGRNVTIRPLTCLFADPSKNGGGIRIENDVLIGSGVHIYTTDHEFSDVNVAIYYQGHQEARALNTVILREGCWIGANVVILKGVEIGKNSVVGAGSVVTKSVPAKTVVAGIPAKVLKKLD